MFIQPHRRALGKVRKLVPTDKEPLPGTGMKEEAYWVLARCVRDEFGTGGAAPEDIYQKILGPKGLTADDTYELINGAKDHGYLKSAAEVE